MIWQFIKSGTSGDHSAPPIIDENIKTFEVARLRAKQVIYANNKKLKLKVIYPDIVNYEIGDVVYIEGFAKFYQIKSISYSELPYVIIEMTEVI